MPTYHLPRAALALGILCSAVLTDSADASLLIFATPTNGSLNLDATNTGSDDYGYRVTEQFSSNGLYEYGMAGGATPNVIVDYVYGGDYMRGYQSYYGDLPNVVYFNGFTNPSVGHYRSEFSLVADVGYSVSIHSFDMAGFMNYDMPLNSLRIRDQDNNVLYDSGAIVLQGDFTGPRHTTFNFATALTGQRLTIETDVEFEGQNANIGIDNLLMSQDIAPIPEPATGVVGALLGFAGLCVRRRHSAR